MSLWKIAWRSIQQRALASSLNSILIAVGVFLVVIVLVVHSLLGNFFRHNGQGYDMIVGATKGGRMQLVLNTVYHLSQPVENLPYSYYKEFLHSGDHAGRFARYVDVAVPVCLGDSYKEFRVVGTTPAMFEVWEPYQKYEFAQGRNFEQDHFFEAVIGSVVAATTGLKVGDQFQPTHGVEDTEGAHKHDAFAVVGVLKPTGTPNDRALFINMEGFYLLQGHAKEEEQAHGQKAAHDHEETHHEAGETADHDHHSDKHEHDEHSAEQHGHEDHAHEDHAHEDHAHEDHAHEDHAHEDHAEHEHAAHASESDADADHEHHAAEVHDDHDHAHDGDADHEHAAADHAHEHGDDHDHHAHAHTPLPESQREVTALLVRTSSDDPMSPMVLRRLINKGNEAQAVSPAVEIQTLTDTFVDKPRLLLLVLTVLIVVMAGISIMVSIYNSMSERRREIAIMRALGARRATVLSVILLESNLLTIGGGVLGWLLAHATLALASPWILQTTGFAMGSVQFAWQELLLPPALLVLATLVGYVPGIAAYQTDVGKALTAAP